VTSRSPAIVTERLTKRFGATEALSGLDLAVEPGTVVGLLGPAGAGKTTAIRVLSGRLDPDDGRALVGGREPAAAGDLIATDLGTPRPVVLLDEPTLDLDDAARAAAWTSIRALAAGGAAVVFTTCSVEEASRISDQVVVLSAGRAAIRGTPAEVAARVGGRRVESILARAEQRPAAEAALAALAPLLA
jgi:ABC-type multidrug transport system ATPase subunit